MNGWLASIVNHCHITGPVILLVVWQVLFDMLEVALWGSGNCQENENDNILQHARFNQQGKELNVLAYIHLIVITNPNLRPNPNLDSDPSPNPKASSCSRWEKNQEQTNKQAKKKRKENTKW